MISSKVKYGVQAIVFLANYKDEEFVSSRTISEKLNIPKEFISKILQSLVHTGYVGSKKGNGGGFYLSAPPSEIKLERLFKALDHFYYEGYCFLGGGDLCLDDSCNLCIKWGGFIDEFEHTIKRITIGQLKKIEIK